MLLNFIYFKTHKTEVKNKDKLFTYLWWYNLVYNILGPKLLNVFLIMMILYHY